MEQTPHRNGRAEVYERRDMSVRLIGTFLAGLIVTVIVVLLLMGWLFDYFQAREAQRDLPPSPLAEARQVPSGPILQVAPRQDLKAMRIEEDALLHSYGWVDQKTGIVRIPIDRAMKLLAQRGLPALMIRAWRDEFTPQHHAAVEITGLYWHFVDIVWIFLFPLLYLIERHR